MRKLAKKNSCKFAPQKIRVNSHSRYLRTSALSCSPRKSAFTGLIQVYTGDGKGKTTAAIGQAIRALGEGLKVCFIQFFKEPKIFPYGERRVLHYLPEVDFYSFAPKHPHFFKKINSEEVKKNLQEGLSFIKKILQEKQYNLLILDELIIALRDKFLSTEELIHLLSKKPKNMEIILTGRGAPKKLIDFADLVTEMKKIKHPYDKGIKGRKGIEY